MKTYNVITTVHTLKGEMFVGDPIKLSDKELEKITETVNTRNAIRIQLTKETNITQRFIPLQSIHYIEVKAKETGENNQ